jgi:hypothetical protein
MRKLGIVLAGLFALGLIGSIFGDDQTQITTKSKETQVVASEEKPTPSVPTTTVPLVSKKKLKAALAMTNIKTDDVEGKTWYRAKTSPTYVNRNGFFLYLGKESGSDPYLRFRIQYFGKEWLFINSFIINVDGVRYDIQPGSGDLERDNDASVWEWYDVSPSLSDVEMLLAISKSKKTVVRMVGDQYRKDVVISATQKRALSTMFTVYMGLGGSSDSL